MSRMGATGLTIVCLLFVSMTVGTAFAASEVGWWHLQKRTYENGNELNRLAFATVDGAGNYLLTDVVESVTLYDPNGDPIAIPPHNFGVYKILSGNYDAETDQWNYGSVFHTENYISINFQGDLTPGNYRLVVAFSDGSPSFDDTQSFNGVFELPELSSKSFRGYKDSAGNLIVRWDPPYDSSLYAPGAPTTSMRAWLSIFDAGSYVGDLFVKVPTPTAMWFVPKSVMDLVEAEGNKYEVQMQLRTDDNNNRYYTDSVPLDKLKRDNTKVVVIPIN